MTEKNKTCSKCKKEFPATLEFFHGHNVGKGGLHSRCKKCRCASSRKYHHDNREKCREYKKIYHRKYRKRRREKGLKRNYNITSEQYNWMFKQQSGRCAVCGSPETMKYKGELKHLSVDHDHKTGEIRGLLCCNCNHALGCVSDSKELLLGLALYLEKWGK